MSGRSRRRRLWQGAAATSGVVLTVALTQNTTTAAFTAQTSDTGNSVTAQTDFCSLPGHVDTLSAGTVDTSVYLSQPTTPYNTNSTIGTISSASAIARALIKFPLDTRPAGCAIASAVLTLRVSSGTAGGTIHVHRAAAAWNPATVTWNTDPGYVGDPAVASSATNGTVVTWDVKPQVIALYAGPDHGFEIKDSAEGVGNISQIYDSMEAGITNNRPKLVVTWN